MPVIADRLEGLHLDQRTGKSLIIRRPGELSIQPRRAGFQRILRARNQLFHVQQYAKIPAEGCAILVRDARKLLGAQRALASFLDEPLRQVLICVSGCNRCV